MAVAVPGPSPDLHVVSVQEKLVALQVPSQ